MQKRPTTHAQILDLCAYRASRSPWEAAEVAGRLEHSRNLHEARVGVAAVLALKSPDVESVALALHRAAGEMDDITFSMLVDAMA